LVVGIDEGLAEAAGVAGDGRPGDGAPPVAHGVERAGVPRPGVVVDLQARDGVALDVVVDDRDVAVAPGGPDGVVHPDAPGLAVVDDVVGDRDAAAAVEDGDLRAQGPGDRVAGDRRVGRVEEKGAVPHVGEGVVGDGDV